jgi:hypothetical protein
MINTHITPDLVLTLFEVLSFEDINKKPESTCGDCRVGHVKCRPMIAS